MSIVAGCIVPHPPLIIPGVGKGREEAIRRTTDSYIAISREIARLSPETLLVISPHATGYADYIHISPGSGASGNLRQFGAPEALEVAYDTEFVRALESICEETGFPAGTKGAKSAELDHGSFIPLYFLLREIGGVSVVRIAPSGLSREQHYRFGMQIREAADRLGRRTVVVASGDLSHKLAEDGPYGYAPEGPRLDRALTDIMRFGDFEGLLGLPEQLCQNGAECGYLPFLMMAGALDGLAIRSELLSYEGPFGVGYAVASFEVTGANPQNHYLDRYRAAQDRADVAESDEDAYVRLAKRTLEAYVRTGQLPDLPPDLPEELLSKRAGVFVSIKKDGELRGCIGTTGPTQPSLALEIRQNAISSGTGDPRFSPVREKELNRLSYSVDVLYPPEDADRGLLDPARYGVIVSAAGRRRGLLLPNLEGVDTVEEQLAIALRKAGIAPDEPYAIQRFEVVRHT